MTMLLRRSMLVAGLLVLISGLVLAQSPTDSVTTQIEKALQEEAVAGAVWALADSTGVRTGAAGYFNRQTGALLTPGARVEVGSITKMVLALGVLRLATEGRLDLDAPIGDVLPQLLLNNPWRATHPLRVHHFLDHTSGIDDARLWQLFTLRPSPATPLLDAVAPDGRLLLLRTPPGRRFSYSNTGYAVLGMVIEQVTSERYESWLDRELLGPLFMRHSSFAFATQAGPGADSTLALGHGDDGSSHATVPQMLRPAVQFTTTAADMAALAQFLLRGDGTIDGQEFIAPSLLRQMGHPIGTEAAAAGLPGGYRFGLARRDRHGVVGLCHGGDSMGFRAMFCLFPSEGKAFFISENSDSETADHGRFDRILIEALQVTPATDAPTEPLEVHPSRWDGWYVPAPGRFEMVAYIDQLFGAARLHWNGDALEFRPIQGSMRVLRPVGARVFTAADRATRSHALLEDGGNGRWLTDGFSTYRRVSVFPLVLLWLSLAAGVVGFLYVVVVGLFRLARPGATGRGVLGLPLFPIALLFLGGAVMATQPFLSLGDPTPGSVILAAGSFILPLAVLGGLMRFAWPGLNHRRSVSDGIALVSLAQWVVVLWVWGLLPLRTWA